MSRPVLTLLALISVPGCTGGASAGKDSGTSRADTGGSDSTVDGEDDSADSTPDSGSDTHAETGSDTHAETGTDTSSLDTSGETGADDTSVPDTSAEDSGLDFDAVIYGVAEDERVGTAAYPAGDVNGDGLQDMWIGKSFYSPQAAYLFEGPVLGTLTSEDADARLTSSAGDYFPSFGPSMCPAGDGDGDGYVDLLFGDSLHDSEMGVVILLSGPWSGEAYVEDGSVWIFGEEEEGGAGDAVVGPGDLDGDGWDDLVLSGAGTTVAGATSDEGDCPDSEKWEDGEEDGAEAGTTWVFFGPVTGTHTTSEADVSLTGEDGHDRSGSWVAGAGDLDGDGLPDLLVNASNQCELAEGGGATYIVLSPTSESVSLSDANGKIMAAVSPYGAVNAGDINGDGTPDILWLGRDSTMREASVLLISGPALGDAVISDGAARIDQGALAEYIEYDDLSAPGDLNADGFDDLLLVDHMGDPDTWTGSAYFFRGPLTGTHDLSEADLSVPGPVAGAGLGSAAAGLGDTDGDGLPDVLLGARWESTTADDAGAAYLLLGGGSVLGAL